MAPTIGGANEKWVYSWLHKLQDTETQAAETDTAATDTVMADTGATDTEDIDPDETEAAKTDTEEIDPDETEVAEPDVGETKVEETDAEEIENAESEFSSSSAATTAASDLIDMESLTYVSKAKYSKKALIKPVHVSKTKYPKKAKIRSVHGSKARFSKEAAVKSEEFGESVFDENGNLASFTCFGKLPKELRFMIWDWVMKKPRVVRLFHNVTKTGRNSPTIYSPTPPPLTLRICSESRTQALTKFKLAFAREGKYLPRVYFDFENDILALDQCSRGPQTGRFHIIMLVSAFERSKVRSVMVDDFQLETLQGHLNIFGNVKTLYVTLFTTLREPRAFQNVPTLPLTKTCRFTQGSLVSTAYLFEDKVRRSLQRLRNMEVYQFKIVDIIVSHLNEQHPYCFF